MKIRSLLCFKMLVSAYPLTLHRTSAVLQQTSHKTCTKTLMSLLEVKQQLMVVQPAGESRVLNTTGGHSKCKTSHHALEFLRDQHLLRWLLNSMPFLNSKPHCRDNNSLSSDAILSWLKPFHILLLRVNILILSCICLGLTCGFLTKI